jgi:hypothetical protein
VTVKVAAGTLTVKNKLTAKKTDRKINRFINLEKEKVVSWKAENEVAASDYIKSRFTESTEFFRARCSTNPAT